MKRSEEWIKGCQVLSLAILGLACWLCLLGLAWDIKQGGEGQFAPSIVVFAGAWIALATAAAGIWKLLEE